MMVSNGVNLCSPMDLHHSKLNSDI